MPHIGSGHFHDRAQTVLRLGNRAHRLCVIQCTQNGLMQTAYQQHRRTVALGHGFQRLRVKGLFQCQTAQKCPVLPL